jgi:FKBP-type peptidyl-prolyl cis-trans isomerase SlyD
MTEIISKNKYVEFTYSITNDEGQIIEQVEMPVNYVHGVKMGLWPKLEDALENKKIDDQVNVTFEPGEVFGEVDKDLIFEDEIKNVPEEYRQLGKVVEFQNESGDVKPFTVTEITDSKIILDGNHPLCNLKINFNVTILNIRDATQTEISALNEVTED